MGISRVKCEICGEEFFATGDGARRCYKCNSEFLNKGMIEDGAKSFEGESDINCPYCGKPVSNWQGYCELCGQRLSDKFEYLPENEEKE